MKKRLSIILSFVLGLVILSTIYFKIDFKEVITTFTNITLPIILMYFLAVFMIEFFLVLRWDTILKAQNKFVPFRNLFMYKEIGYAIGYLSPQAHIGGEPVRAFLLKRHNIDFKKGLSSILIDKSMQIMTDSVFGIMGVIILLLVISVSRQIKILIVVIGIFPIILLFLFYYRMFNQKTFFIDILRFLKLNKIRLVQKLEKEIIDIEYNVLDFFQHHRDTFGKIILINIILWFCMFLEYKSALLLFGHNASIRDIFLVIATVGIAYLMPVPLALGVLEAGQVTILGFLGLKKVIGISLSILIRTKDIIRTGIGLLFLSFCGLPWNWKKKRIDKKMTNIK